MLNPGFFRDRPLAFPALLATLFAGSLFAQASKPATPPKKPAAPSSSPPNPWLITLDRPKPGDQIVTGEAPDGSRTIRLVLINGKGDPVEDETHTVAPEAGKGTHWSFVVGFRAPLPADSAIQSYTISPGKAPVPDKLVLVQPPQAQSRTATNNTQNQPANPPQTATGASPRVAPQAQTPAPAPNSNASGPTQASADATPPAPPANPCDTSNASPGLDLDKTTVLSGHTRITGKSFTVQAGDVVFCVNSNSVKVALTSDPTNFKDSVSFTGGALDVTLQNPLKSNQSFTGIATATSTDGKKTIASQSFPSITPGIPTLDSRNPPTLQTDLVPGVSEIDVIGIPTPASAAYEVRVTPCPGSAGPDGPLDIKWTTANRFWENTNSNGTAVFTLNTPLNAGQQVRFCETIVDTTDPNAPVQAAAQPTLTLVNDPLDLGRVRYSFTSGVVLSQNNGFQAPSGSNAGLFLAFDADRAWLPLNTHGMSRFNINTFFDARLTSVATQNATSTTTTGSATPSTSPSTFDTFKSSSQAASLEAGIYAPLVTTPWAKDRYSLFLGPLFKAGFVTLTDQQIAAASAQSTSTASSTTTTTTQTAALTDRFYTNYALGSRIGVFRHFHSRDAAPDLISFVDIAVGKFGDFEAVRLIQPAERDNMTGYSLTNEMISLRPWRVSLEGLLRIPRTPLVLGFNANIGLSSVHAQMVKDGMTGTPFLVPFALPKDDLRFLLGARFDAGKLFRSLPTLQ
jgi:hypothetical protein